MKHQDFLELLIGPTANEGGGGSSPTGTVDIVANGTANVAAYADANVAVPGGLYNGQAFDPIPANAVIAEALTTRRDTELAGMHPGQTNVHSGNVSLDLTITRGDYLIVTGTTTPSGKSFVLAGVVTSVNQFPTYQYARMTLRFVIIDDAGKLTITSPGWYDLRGYELAEVSGGGGGSANDWAYAFISGGYEGVLTDSEDPTVPRITRVIAGAMENELGLTGVNLPACTEIGANAFNGCSNLESVNIPVCTEIKSSAIQNCGSIKTFNAPLCTNINSGVMAQMWKLESINLNAVETLGSNAILGVQPNAGSGRNTTLKLVELPALKTANGNFASFLGMTAMRLGSAVTSLSGNFARYNTLLDTVIFGQNQAAVPTMGTQYTFGGTAIRDGNGYIYVPDALEANWKAATLWSAIAAQIKPLSAILDWTAGTYNKPDVVKHNGRYYRCNTDGTTGEPGVDTTNWQDLGEIY